MNDRWARVTEILDRALAEPPEWREAFIVAACAGDDALAAEVRSLLAHAVQSENFLEPGHTRLEPIGTAAGAPAPLGPGSLIGAWRLVSHIGEGGMGAVWLAERAEGQFTQRGALKLLRIGLAFEEAIRRFRRERQILASLDHPNIAHLLDGGSTPDGLPYLVMEYIEGRLLYAHCAAEQVPLAERLELFLDLCEAVHSAHQRLVVHRDLKPGNVMVTGEGTVKLLDFGVAKIFEAEAADAASALRTTDLPFTPLYASPEQLRGEEVGTASDVYSLGVLLYELLTGAHPYAREVQRGFRGNPRRARHRAHAPQRGRVGSRADPGDGGRPSATTADGRTACAGAKALGGSRQHRAQGDGQGSGAPLLVRRTSRGRRHAVSGRPSDRGAPRFVVLSRG